MPIDDERSSKSARKRHAGNLQSLGRRLAELGAAELERVPISDTLRRAIGDYHRFPSHQARHRQLQFIGRVMRDEDETAVRAALEAIEHAGAAERYEHHQLEAWRERLLADDMGITRFLDAYPTTDSRQLRVLVRKARRAQGDDARHAGRALFRFLRTARELDRRDES